MLESKQSIDKMLLSTTGLVAGQGLLHDGSSGQVGQAHISQGGTSCEAMGCARPRLVLICNANIGFGLMSDPKA